MATKSTLIQIAATLIICVGNYSIGFSTAWSSYTLEFYETVKSPFPTLSETEKSLVGSLPMLGCFLSVLCSGAICDGVGRRKTTVLSGICYVLSWSLIVTAHDIILVLIGRFMIGISNGIHFVACIPYVGEIAKPSLSGKLFSTLSFAYCFGGLMSYICGWVCSYEVINYMNLSLSVIFVLLVTWLEETPVYLLGKGNEKEALKALQFYRWSSNPTEKILKELEYIKSQLPQKTVPDLEKPLTEKEAVDEPRKKDIEDISVWKILKNSKADQRALILSAANMILFPMSGTIAVSAYAAKLFTMAAPSLSPHMCSVILALSFAVGSFITMFIIDSIGRRILLFLSLLSSSICLLLLSSLLRWGWAPQWSLPVMVLAFCFCFQLGVNVPFVQINEIFSAKVKSFAPLVGLSSMTISNFVVLAVFQFLVNLLGLDGIFLMFAIICIIICIFNALFLRETRGVPYSEIQMSFEKGYLYRKA